MEEDNEYSEAKDNSIEATMRSSRQLIKRTKLPPIAKTRKGKPIVLSSRNAGDYGDFGKEREAVIGSSRN